jgi:hypothetical protein
MSESESLPVVLFYELAGVPVDDGTVLAAAQQLLDGCPVPMLALGTFVFDERGQPRMPNNPMLIFPGDLPVAEALIEQAQETIKTMPRDPGEIFVLARDGQLMVAAIKSPLSAKKKRTLVLLGWLDPDGGCVYTESKHLPLLQKLVREVRVKLQGQGLDPCAPGVAH